MDISFCLGEVQHFISAEARVTFCFISQQPFVPWYLTFETRCWLIEICHILSQQLGSIFTAKQNISGTDISRNENETTRGKREKKETNLISNFCITNTIISTWFSWEWLNKYWEWKLLNFVKLFNFYSLDICSISFQINVNKTLYYERILKIFQKDNWNYM